MEPAAPRLHDDGAARRRRRRHDRPVGPAGPRLRSRRGHAEEDANRVKSLVEEPMATADDLRRLAFALDGTTEAPHFDRAALKAVRIYATLAPDGLTANFKFAPDEQEFKCMM